MTLSEHLGELRYRVVLSTVAFVVAATVCVFAYEPILHFLLRPLCTVTASTKHHTSAGSSFIVASNGTCNLFVTSPLDGLALRIKIAVFGGLVLASPVILFQVWRFVTPGLKARERRYAIPFVLSSFTLFLVGAATAYLTLPHALGWLHSVGGPNLVSIYDPIPYLGLILLMMAIFGLTFEFPVVLVSLELAACRDPGAAAALVAVGGHHHRRGGSGLHPELRPLLHVRPRRAAHGVLLPLHRHREAARALTTSPWPVREAGGAAEFEADLPFTLDEFQLEALEALEAGHSVLVSAPTGSGKTLVAAYGVHRALRARGKAFYTTPLKALSNQKYAELAAIYGDDHVGLLTGDTTLRPRAPVVVMTTEVLRNMLLAGSDLLEGLHTVVLDEVHFIQDPYRGGVWEEVLVLSPPQVRFVCLSATVNNAQELGGWLQSVRGDTAVVVERHRPIDLRHHFAAHRREDDETLLLPLLEAGGKPAGEGLRIDQACRRALQGRPGRWNGSGRGPRLPYRPPRRTEMVEELGARDMLPAIVFIFSRAACDDAVRQMVRDGARLTDAHERSAIRRVAERRVEPLDDDDLRVLGYDEWLEGLERGLAAHHAGLVPVFRETVEECFAAGLLKVVFATETLSLGINMPARSVVIERFTKYGGSGRATLTSGEYLQLTGRAGRRGSTRRATRWWRGRTRSPSPRRPGSPRPPRPICVRPSGPRTTWPSTWCPASTAPRPNGCWSAPSPSGRPANRTCCRASWRTGSPCWRRPATSRDGP